MDSLTHIVLGGSIVAAIAPEKWRRQALVAGAVFGSLPDIDVPILAAFASDPVTRMTWHRGPAHALVVLAVVGPLLWWLLRWRWAPVREAPWRWFCALMLALFSHPLIDALTVYGTQLWWPSPVSPTMWSTLFIIDPLVLLPLTIGAAVAWRMREAPRATAWVAGGLAVCLAYVGWSIVARQLVERAVDETIAGTPLAHARHFSTPEPFNTLLWRVVVMTPDGYLEGDRSLVADRGPIRFRAYPADRDLLAQAARIPDGARLLWFASGFDKASVRGDELVLTDLRMGSEPDYFFNDAIARRVDGRWQPIVPHRIDVRLQGGASLAMMWQRIWQEPPPGNGASR
ncbi:MAG TPA: metal-dependent hydrolase [Xanthomonadaceae bacterium]|jgi:inner membrane protein